MGWLWSAPSGGFRANLRSPTMTHNRYSVLRLEDPYNFMKRADLNVLDDLVDDALGNSEFSEERKNLVSSCRYCAHYAHEGRRGGTCDSLNVDVQGAWTACSLAVSAFSEPVLSESARLEPAFKDALPHSISRLQTYYHHAES